jgi:hypothetical protein
MSRRWLRRRSTKRPSSQLERRSPGGCGVLLQVLDQGPAAIAGLKALAQRYELAALDEDESLFRVAIADSRFPQEAVVKLASTLDEIDRDWQDYLGWPQVE